MQLPRHLFQQITGTHLVRTGGLPRDHRSAGRIPLAGRISLLPVSNGVVGQPIFARLRDISLSGVGLLTHRAIAAGSPFILAVPAAGGKPILMRCQSVRCREVEPGLFVIGAEFTQVLSLQDVPPAEAAATAHRMAV